MFCESIADHHRRTVYHPWGGEGYGITSKEKREDFVSMGSDGFAHPNIQSRQLLRFQVPSVESSRPGASAVRRGNEINHPFSHSAPESLQAQLTKAEVSK